MARVANPSPVRQTSVDAVTPWWELVDWWTDPRLAYARGLVDGYTSGYAAARAEQDAIDDQVHREAVQTVIRIIDTADRRAAADSGTLTLTEQAA